MARDGAHIGFEGVEMDVSRQPGFSQDPLPPIAGGGQSGKHESRVALAGTPRGDDSELTPLNKNQGKGAGHQTVFFKDGKRRIDYVMVYQIHHDETQEWQEKREQKRQDFFDSLKREGLELEEDKDAFDKKSIFVKVHAPWRILMKEAEELFLKMPVEKNNYVNKSWWQKAIESMRFSAESPLNHGMEDVQMYISLPFSKKNEKKFFGVEKHDTFFSPAQRSLMVYGILVRTPYSRDSSKVGFERLIGNKALEAAFPIHEGKCDVHEDEEQNPRSVLRRVWARWGAWYKYQPIDYIRRYFGEKIGIYFCWLGLYTSWLWPAAAVGLLVFIIGCSVSGDDIPSKDICSDDLNTTLKFYMCPPCDSSCDFYFLEESCYYARAALLFDNAATVFFAAFMCVWAVFFLEFWKRTEIRLAYNWDVLGFEEQEERPRAVFEATVKRKETNAVTGRLEAFVPSATHISKLCRAAAIVLFFISIVIAAVVGVIIYRLAIIAAMNKNNSVRKYSSITSTLTSALIQVGLITILDKVYQKIAVILTNWEMHRTQTDHEDNFTFKMFLFQFVNYYSSVFYIAFFKGKFTGYPYNYTKLAGSRLDECGAGGCMIELTQQLAIIMVGKQVVNNVVELLIPKLKAWWRRRDTKDENPDDDKCVQSWEEDYDLADLNEYGLFAEYLEMVIQFGFITLFVAAFPLAPLFALLNNIIEIRLDAYKFITTLRRPVANRAQDIGAASIWYSILDGVAKISVVTNAFIIAVTSDFIPRLLYQYRESNHTNLEGYVDFSLARAPILHDFGNTFSGNYDDTNIIYGQVADRQLLTPGGSVLYNNNNASDTKICRYRSYRDDHGELTKFWWEYLTVALAFVIVFEHVIFILVAFVAWIIPDIPEDLKLQMEREAFLGRQALREHEIGPEREVMSAV